MVVIPTLGQPCLQDCLDVLAAARGPLPQQVVLADDRPDTPDPPPVRIPGRLARRTTVLTLDGRGPAAARNAGWRAAAATEWVAFLDGDVRVSSSWRADLAGGGFPGPPWYPGEHEVARCCRLVRRVRYPGGPGRPAAPGPPAAAGADRARRRAHPSRCRRGQPTLAGRPVRAVARELARRGERVLVTGSAAERTLARHVAELAGLPGRWVLAGQTTLAQLAAHTAAARLVVAGDTGLAHLATAFGRPSVMLFGPVSPAEWGPPVHPRHQVLWRPPDGYRGDPRSYRGDPHGSRTDLALATITVQDVLAAADRALAAGQPGRAPRRPGCPAPRSALALAGRRRAAP